MLLLSEKKVLVIVSILLALVILPQLTFAAPQLKGIEWYQIQDGEEVKVNFVTPNVPYKVVLDIHSDTQTKAHVEIRADIENWPDVVITTKDVILQPGDNRVEVNFIYYLKSWSENGDNPYRGIRGVFAKVDNLYDVSSVSDRFSTQAEVGLSGYYWVGLRMYVNGVEYDPDDYAPVYGGDTVKMNGKLYKDGSPVAGFKIRWIFVINAETSYSYTNSAGYFEKVTTAPDWSKHGMCGDKGRYYAIQAIDSNGNIVTSWEYKCTYKCETTPTPTPSPTPQAEVTINDVIGYSAVGGMLAIGLYLLRKYV